MILENFPLDGLVSARLQLRALQVSDLPDLLEIHRPEAVTRYLPFDPWESMDDARDWYDRAHARLSASEALQLTICSKIDQQVIGSCVIFGFDFEHGCAEVGYVLGQDYWGKGFATEALKVLIEFAFNTLSLRRLSARADSENHASHRVVRNNGFTDEGCLRERLLIDGQPHSVRLFGLLLAEWQGEGNQDSL